MTEIIFPRFSSLCLHLFSPCLHLTLCHAPRPAVKTSLHASVLICRAQTSVLINELTVLSGSMTGFQFVAYQDRFLLAKVGYFHIQSNNYRRGNMFILKCFKSVSMRKPGRRWYSSNHRFCSNLTQMLGLVSEWLWQKLRLKYYIQVRRTFSKNGPLSLIYAYLISCLRFSIATKRKTIWKRNPLDHVLLLLVSKHIYSSAPDNLIALRGSILQWCLRDYGVG